MDKDKSTLSPPEENSESTAWESHWWKNWKIMLPLWGAMVLFIWVGIYFNIDAKVIAGSVFLFALLSNAFTWLVGAIAMIPFVGPLIVRVLSLGLIWLLNAIGYLVAFVAIRRGYSKDVLTYRGMTIALIIGIIIGYVLGKLL
jgi:hypothetical protein